MSTEILIGQDAEMQYLIHRFDDGTIELATRPRVDKHVQPSVRWSPPVALRAAE